MRHFVLGSGPSLNDTPLDLLQGEITWAMNRIHLIYPTTVWRPTYYMMVDHNMQNPVGYWKDCIRAHYNTPKWLWRRFKDGWPREHSHHEFLPDGVGEVPNTTWIPRCQKHHYYQGDNIKAVQSWHLPELCTGLTGLSTMMQLAVQKGATEIYLLGCDLGYTDNNAVNHFTPEYTSDYRPRAERDNMNMTKAHEMAKRSSPVPIFNATIGGSLEVHPRVDLMEILKP